MPPGGVRGRRGRGRVWKRGAGRPSPTSPQGDTEADTTSKTDQLSVDKDSRFEERRGTSRRKGRPPSRARGRRGRGRRDSTELLDQTDVPHVESEDLIALDETTDPLTDPISIDKSRRGRGNRRHRKHDSISISDTEESEGENAVSEEESQAMEDVSAASPVLKQSSPFGRSRTLDSTAGDHEIETEAMDYPFPIFHDDRGILRAKNATFVMPICIGSIDFWQGKKAPEKKCHKWTVYVRSPGAIDLSHVIKRVAFQLHQSFPQPLRIIDKPPYELEESGWGEFDIGISIEFHEDAGGPSVEMTHALKLYTTSATHEHRDDVMDDVTSEPPAAFFKRIQETEDNPAAASTLDPYFPRYDAAKVDESMHRINMARSRIRQEARASIAKAEANGIVLDPVDIERWIGSDDRQDATALTSKGETLQPERGGTTRIVIDADADPPLRIEIEKPRSEPVTSIDELRPTRAVVQKSVDGLDAMRDVAIDTMEIDPIVVDRGDVDDGAPDDPEVAIEGSGSKSSVKVEDPGTGDATRSEMAMHLDGRGYASTMGDVDRGDNDGSTRGSGDSPGGASATGGTTYESLMDVDV